MGSCSHGASLVLALAFGIGPVWRAAGRTGGEGGGCCVGTVLTNYRLHAGRVVTCG